MRWSIKRYRPVNMKTSHALLTFGLSNMPSTRIAMLFQLAQHLQQQENTELVAQLLSKGRSLAILDTQLSPLEQAEALMQCTKSFLSLNFIDEAADTASQIKHIVEQTPDLLPAERSRILQDLLPLTTQLRDDTLRQQVQELARSPYLNPNGIIIQRELHLADGSLELPSELAAIVHERQLLARQLAIQLLQNPLADTSALRQALEEILRKEDEQRMLYFKQILGSQNLTFSLQFWSLHEQHNWLLLKLAIAHRAFGLSLIPAWETDTVTIVDALTQVTDQLEIVLSTSPDPQPELFDQLLQRIAALRWLAIQIELGFYPQRRAIEVGEQLRIAQNELATHGTTSALPLSFHSDVMTPGYRIDGLR